MSADVVVIGAGTVGAALAYGLAIRGARVLLLDGGDRDFRAATANFGLIWSQGKGMDMPAYQQLTRDSADQWPSFCAEIEGATGLDLQYERRGGLTLCLGEAEFEARRTKMLRLQSQSGRQQADWEMVERGRLERLLPKLNLGPEVTGASYGQRDGHANPLRLLTALHLAVVQKGGKIRSRSWVRSIRGEAGGGVTLQCGDERIAAGRVVIAAGLGSKALAAEVGLDLPIRPQRGQVLVTERVESLLPLPLHAIRQTGEGTIMIGATHEEAGLDSSTTTRAAAGLSARAIRWIPALSALTLVRQWAGLRIMTPDSYPIYAQSQSCPGAFVATCHSGVTLAPTHAHLLAESVLAGRLPASLDAFHQRRFDVPQAA